LLVFYNLYCVISAFIEISTFNDLAKCTLTKIAFYLVLVTLRRNNDLILRKYIFSTWTNSFSLFFIGCLLFPYNIYEGRLSHLLLTQATEIFKIIFFIIRRILTNIIDSRFIFGFLNFLKHFLSCTLIFL
jgi:hypothetical protein